MGITRNVYRALLAALASWAIGCSSDEDSADRDPSADPPSLSEKTDAKTELPENAPLPSWELLGETPRDPAADDWFEDVSERCGIDFTYRDGREAGFYQLLELVGGGVAVFDFDQDGDVDLFFTGGGGMDGPPIRLSGRRGALFRNDGDWKFTDVTSQAGLDSADVYSHGCTVGDYNRDGLPDLFVAGYRDCRLYRNVKGERFEDVTAESGLDCDQWNVTGAWADVDLDGWLDLYVVTYCDWQPDASRLCVSDNGLRDTCPPKIFRGAPDSLWRNRGDGTFEEISSQYGLVNRNRGLGVVITDFDQDRWMDIFVANDTEANQFYRGRKDLKSEQVGTLYGVAYSTSGEREGSMGVDVGDFDGDGHPDLWYTNYVNEDNSMMRKLPNQDGFINVTQLIGIAGLSRRWVGFGTALVDFDHDGWQDVFISNGHVGYKYNDGPYFQPAQLLRNDNGKTFRDISVHGGPYFSVSHAGRGVGVGDLDDDGAMDLIVVHQNDPVVILRNRNKVEHWVRVLLRGTESNPDAVGASVTFQLEDRKVTRWVRGGGSYLSFSDPRITIPLQADSEVQVAVRWPSGKTEAFTKLSPNKTHVLLEGSTQTESPGNKD